MSCLSLGPTGWGLFWCVAVGEKKPEKRSHENYSSWKIYHKPMVFFKRHKSLCNWSESLVRQTSESTQLAGLATLARTLARRDHGAERESRFHLGIFWRTFLSTVSWSNSIQNLDWTPTTPLYISYLHQTVGFITSFAGSPPFLLIKWTCACWEHSIVIVGGFYRHSNKKCMHWWFIIRIIVTDGGNNDDR